MKKAGGRIRRRNTAHNSDDADDAVFAQVVFSTRAAAEQALNGIANPKFKLRLSANAGSFSQVDGHSVVTSSS